MAYFNLNLTGQTDLLQAAAVLERAHLFVGNDSGIGHLANAVGTATVTVFGPGDPERYHPRGPYSLWLRGTDDNLENLATTVVANAARQLLAKLP